MFPGHIVDLSTGGDGPPSFVALCSQTVLCCLEMSTNDNEQIKEGCIK